MRLEEKLDDKIPNRKAQNYKARNVLELKGQFLETLSEAMPLDPKMPSGSTHVMSDELKEAKGAASINTLINDHHLEFPSEISFCDLSSLTLPVLPQHAVSERVLIRKESEKSTICWKAV